MDLTIELYITLGGLVVAFFFNTFQLWSMNKSMQLQNDRMRSELFSRYTHRNQEIVLEFPSNITDADFSYDRLETEEREHIMRYMKAYFNLCSEEFYLYQRGLLEEYVWNEWKNGMAYAFNRPAFKIAFHKIYKDVDCNHDFQEFAHGLIKK